MVHFRAQKGGSVGRQGLGQDRGPQIFIGTGGPDPSRVARDLLKAARGTGPGLRSPRRGCRGVAEGRELTVHGNGGIFPTWAALTMASPTSRVTFGQAVDLVLKEHGETLRELADK